MRQVLSYLLVDPFYMRIVTIRASALPAALAPLVEREIRALDADMPIADLMTMEQVVRTGVGYLMFHIGTVQSGAMGILGLLLSVVGVYGVVSYGASLRTREMGIRIALGAEPRNVRWLVLRQGTVLVIAGIACGLALANRARGLLSPGAPRDARGPDGRAEA
jgi:putative ABC transport system permease protein